MPTIATLSVSLTARVDKLERQMKKARGSVDGMTKSVRRSSFVMKVWNAQAAWLIRSFSVIAAGRIFAGAIHSTEMFSRAMNRSLAIMKGVTDQMRGELRKAALDLAKTSIFIAKQIAEGYFFLASAGLDAARSLRAVGMMTKFAQAGGFDLARATDLLTDALSAAGLAAKDEHQYMTNLTRLANLLTKANTTANASIEQFAEALSGGAAAAAALVGQELEETLAVLAVFADRGIKSSEASTRFGQVLRDVQTKSFENREEFRKLGISVFDAEGNFRGLIKVMEDLERVMGKGSASFKKHTLMQLGFTDKAAKALTILFGTSEQMKDFREEYRDVGDIVSQVAKDSITPMQEAINELTGAWQALADTMTLAAGTGIKQWRTFKDIVLIALHAAKQTVFPTRPPSGADLAGPPISLMAKDATQQLDRLKEEEKRQRRIADHAEKRALVEQRTRQHIEKVVDESVEVVRTYEQMTAEIGKTAEEIELMNLKVKLGKAFYIEEIKAIQMAIEAVQKKIDVEKAFEEQVKRTNEALNFQSRMEDFIKTPFDEYVLLLDEIATKLKHLPGLRDEALRKVIEQYARDVVGERMANVSDQTFSADVVSAARIRFLNKPGGKKKQEVFDAEVLKEMKKQTDILESHKGIVL